MQTCIDFRQLEPRARHAVFFSLFEGLKEDGSFGFINDHDPIPLYQQLTAMKIDNLSWEYEVRGPDIWQIRISKKADEQTSNSKTDGLSDVLNKRGS